MMHAREMGLLMGLITLTLAVPGAAAQSVDSEVGQEFLGRWIIELEPMEGFGGGGGMGGGPGGGPGGMQPLVLDIESADGTLAAELTGGRGPMADQPRRITEISQVDGTLVLSYSMSMAGNAFPATIRLTPDSEVMRVQMSFGDQFTRSGTARRE